MSSPAVQGTGVGTGTLVLTDAEELDDILDMLELVDDEQLKAILDDDTLGLIEEELDDILDDDTLRLIEEELETILDTLELVDDEQLKGILDDDVKIKLTEEELEVMLDDDDTLGLIEEELDDILDDDTLGLLEEELEVMLDDDDTLGLIEEELDEEALAEGHSRSLHGTFFSAGPRSVQSFPPLDGGGLVQVLVYVFTPSPHVTLHSETFHLV